MDYTFAKIFMFLSREFSPRKRLIEEEVCVPLMLPHIHAPVLSESNAFLYQQFSLFRPVRGGSSLVVYYPVTGEMQVGGSVEHGLPDHARVAWFPRQTGDVTIREDFPEGDLLHDVVNFCKEFRTYTHGDTLFMG